MRLMRTYCVAQGTLLSASNLNGKELQKRQVYVYIADSICCTVETNNIVKQLYFNKN